MVEMKEIIDDITKKHPACISAGGCMPPKGPWPCSGPICERMKVAALTEKEKSE